jgi:D-sedoheptulose 7-phosphate isomerase
MAMASRRERACQAAVVSHASRYFQRVGELLSALAATDATGRTLPLDSACGAVVAGILDVRRARKKVVLIGNGGSASIAGHMEMDLCNRVGVRAHVFNDPPVLTALANDHGYPAVFERLVALWGEPGDCLFAISSSGQSPNILRSARAARTLGFQVITFSGFQSDNPLRRMGDYNFYVDSDEYGEVEVVHHALGHFLTDRAAATIAAITNA